MDSIQQRIIEIALQIPDYVGYQAKERRRDADKLVRRQLAARYDEQRTRLSRIARQSPIEYVVDLDNLDQKLQRLIARLNTAPGGYAGWFDAGQIVEGDLDQLTQFDASLAEGVGKLKSVLDQLASAVKSRQGVDDAVGVGAELLDGLNSQFDQREQFLQMGKKPSLGPAVGAGAPSPLDALNVKQNPPADFVALTTLKLKDALSLRGTDYIVTGTLIYTYPSGSFWSFLLQDIGTTLWLRVGPGTEITVCNLIPLETASPPPATIDFDHVPYVKGQAGTANVTVEGASGVKRGSVNYVEYSSGTGRRLWIEDFGSETRTMAGDIVDSGEFQIYRR